VLSEGFLGDVGSIAITKSWHAVKGGKKCKKNETKDNLGARSATQQGIQN